ncbi:hypothetical protein ACH4TQ_27715 [Streptomyces sp. NPDC021218]|uniref:hypothetical protein n=1 Tax=unclassified Streptomyces TaxID=2593676 RepID=UPI0036862AE1
MTVPEQAATVLALVDPDTLTHAQTGGWDCVLCGLRLIDAPSRPLGTVTVKRGSARVVCEVWACAPTCGNEPAPLEPEATAWSQFLGHAVDCLDCRTGELCSAGGALHREVRANLPGGAL